MHRRNMTIKHTPSRPVHTDAVRSSKRGGGRLGQRDAAHAAMIDAVKARFPGRPLAEVLIELKLVAHRDVVADATAGPGDCSQLPAAVENYIAESMAKAPEVRRKQLEGSIATMVPALQKAFVEVCTADTWTASVVACHVDNATALARFEQCRQMLTSTQREHLDKELTAALTATAPVPSATTP